MEHDYLLSNPYYVKALEYIKEHNLFAYEPGKYVIDGDNLWLNINDSVLKTQKEARLEVHDRYIDIQIPLSAPETFGVARRSDCSQPVGEMDKEKDILFFADPVRKTETVDAGKSITFAPDEAHAPLIKADGFAYPVDDDGRLIIRKAIFKVKVC